jgi:hypothetical protein
MKRGFAAATALLGLVLAGSLTLEGQAPSPASTPASADAKASTPQATAPTTSAPTTAATPAATKTAAVAPSSSPGALIDQYCMTCHADRVKSGGLALSALNVNDAHPNAEIAEKVIRKLRGGLMPPAGAKRPDAPTAAAFVSWLETKVDADATVHPGHVALRRLNRREYANAIHDLLGLDIDPKAWLPDDNGKGHFDNEAAALQVSPNFVDQYIYAARAIALEAVGNRKAPAETTTYGDVAAMVISLPPAGAPGTGRQQHHLDGMPLGTRGGMTAEHNFPADGEYELTIGDMALAREVPRMEFENTVIVLLDGKEFYRTNIGGEVDHKAIDQRLDPAVEEINGRLRKIRFKTTAGQHTIAITFVKRSDTESDERTRTTALEGGQERIQAVHALQIRGPLSVTGMSLTGSRAKIFTCYPTSGTASKTAAAPSGAATRVVSQQRPVASAKASTPAAVDTNDAGCAREIISTLARRAFRRPVTDEDLTPLMAFYKAGSATGGFEGGVRDALSAILASPHFLYRAESGDPGPGGIRTLSDLELASRLSFFLWSSLPDDELLKLASESRLSKPDVLSAQVSRMLADPRSKTLSNDFAFQWLHLSKLDEITPDRGQFPYAAGLLDQRALMKEELQLFIDSVLRPSAETQGAPGQDRAASGTSAASRRSDPSVFELLTADYTFINERLAMLYGMENVKGDQFRRVTLTNPARYGLLGKGAILSLTAYPNRTSPVLRGAWILDRLLGTPPSDPPLNVPTLPENRRGQPAKTLRARLEQHRANATCFACHGIMDPLGFALENFNAVGQYRVNDPDTQTPIDTTGQLPDGSTIKGPEDLRRALVERPDHQFVQTLTENLMTYALGRNLDYRDMPTVRRIVKQSAAENYTFKSIVLGVVSSDAFRKREAEGSDVAPLKTASASSTRTGGQ